MNATIDALSQMLKFAPTSTDVTKAIFAFAAPILAAIAAVFVVTHALLLTIAAIKQLFGHIFSLSVIVAVVAVVVMSAPNTGGGFSVFKAWSGTDASTNSILSAVVDAVASIFRLFVRPPSTEPQAS